MKISARQNRDNPENIDLHVEGLDHQLAMNLRTVLDIIAAASTNTIEVERTTNLLKGMVSVLNEILRTHD